MKNETNMDVGEFLDSLEGVGRWHRRGILDMNIDDLTVGQLEEIRTLIGHLPTDKPTDAPLPFGVGDYVLIRTVTMTQVGKVTAIGSDFFVLEDGGWVADTGRFGEALRTGKLGEFERAPSWMLVMRGVIDDVYPWPHSVPKESL